jgi:hypothetical protein
MIFDLPENTLRLAVYKISIAPVIKKSDHMLAAKNIIISKILLPYRPKNITCGIAIISAYTLRYKNAEINFPRTRSELSIGSELITSMCFFVKKRFAKSFSITKTRRKTPVEKERIMKLSLLNAI